MKCIMDLDWCTYECPCGESLCTRHESVESVTAWIDQHRPHTDGTLKTHISDDGARILGDDAKRDYTRKL